MARGRKPGSQKTGGRKKGVKNKATVDARIIKSSIADFVSGEQANFYEALKAQRLLRPSEYIKNMLTLFEFVYPKQSRVDHNVDSGVLINVNLTPIE